MSAQATSLASTAAVRPPIFRSDLPGLLAHMRKRWYLYGPVFAVWAFAYTRLFVDPTPRLPLLFNWTPSLPYHVAWMQPGTSKPQRGDLIVFRFDGPGQQRYPGLRGQPFFKRIAGLPGDVVAVQGRLVQVNGETIGLAKTHTFDRHPLAPIGPLVIPHGHYFVQGTAADSFDSRYSDSGLVRFEQVLGVVVPLL
jgi:conjugal transfer pilin signal peptidase TrbI